MRKLYGTFSPLKIQQTKLVVAIANQNYAKYSISIKITIPFFLRTQKKNNELKSHVFMCYHWCFYLPLAV